MFSNGLSWGEHYMQACRLNQRKNTCRENLLRGFIKLQLLENALSRDYKSLKHIKRHGKTNKQ